MYCEVKSEVCQWEQELEALLLNYLSDKKLSLATAPEERRSCQRSVLQCAKFWYLLIKVEFTNTAHKSQETSQKVEDKNLKEIQSEKTEVSNMSQKACKDGKLSFAVGKLFYKLIQSSWKLSYWEPHKFPDPQTRCTYFLYCRRGGSFHS